MHLSRGPSQSSGAPTLSGQSAPLGERVRVRVRANPNPNPPPSVSAWARLQGPRPGLRPAQVQGRGSGAPGQRSGKG